MEHRQILKYLKEQADLREQTSEALRKWHSHTDALEFFLRSASDDVPLVIFAKGLYLYSIAAPLSSIHDEYVEDIGKWNFSVPSGYGYGYVFSDGNVKEFVSDPLEDRTKSKILDAGTAFFFLRHFDRREGRKNYLEINQKVSHILGLHWIEDKSAWCDIDNRGQVVPKAKYIVEGDLSFCTLRRDDLDFFLFLTKSCLVRCFYVTRLTDWTKFGADTEEIGRIADPKNQIFADLRTQMGKEGIPYASFLRGFDILKNEQPREKMVAILKGEVPREYASFIIWYWKHAQICEWSTKPEEIGNYFVESMLPFGTSPAFFKPEVLLQYKQDPTRYEIGERIISCLGGWELQYDINEEGQIHVYLADLSHLPYEEQLHWKAFNEKPRTGLSKRAIQTDFKAQWDTTHSPLQSLKKVLEIFPQNEKAGRPSQIWAMPSVPNTRDLKFLNYIVTESQKEWEDQILALGQILGDGFARKNINAIADAMGCRNEKMGPIKQLGLILEKGEIADWDKIIGPIVEAWDLRSKTVAHPGRARPKGDLKAHYKELLSRCDESMRELARLVEDGFFVTCSIGKKAE